MASSSRQLGATWAGGSDESPPLSNGGRHHICADWVVGHRCPSDNDQGYANHSPTCDLCVISPTAALSSFPYAPAEAARAMRYFYTERGHRIWTDWGFTDAFSISRNWYSSNHLAIDQGPIVCMMENYRSGFLWRLFMRGTRGEDWAAAPGVP